MIFSPTALCFLILQKKRNTKTPVYLPKALWGIKAHICRYNHNVLKGHSQSWEKGREKSPLSVTKLPVPMQESQYLGKRSQGKSPMIRNIIRLLPKQASLELGR